ncbi:hypothetical protein [Mesorhizobium sp. M4B.F.Ca.ET.017.02.2.1]|uniref:hypothetical protein n=1 Tax=Mesorhizobium sp. M4B.F.Ca.ET.017.02.2.1 TaxID=2496649 RepID=UPI000FCACC9A|nr:hypothetical protein [Mesorhizobium sp. M4B.F.Ca.ET.017.02.2.1]RVD31417.1 hypothetical protein EN738_01815 [Mesorhizobium sp. M4B.F.Ca.ET.017.02.2.1]
MATTSVDQITGYGETVAYKAPCRLATTAAIALSGLQTIDGVITDANDRVLVKDQADDRENGIYITSTGLWARARDFDSNRDVTKGTRVDVTDGTANSNTVWKISTSNPITIGTSDINFVAITFGPISVVDEDDMASNSATAVPTQQSVKAYTDAGIASRQPLDADLTALAGIGTAVQGDMIYANGAGTWGRLAKGRALQGFRQNAGATAPEWADFAPGYDVNGFAGANENARIAALYAAAPTNPFIYRSDTHIGIIRDTAPLNYQGTRASLVVQHRDIAAGGTNELIPGVVFSFNSTGDGVVTAASDLSLSIWEGVVSAHKKTGDGSAQAFTVIGELGAYGAGQYNEFGGICGTITNTGSNHGTISGVEFLIRDGDSSTHFDTALHAIIGRVARYHNGARDASNFFASSEGTVGPAAILSASPGGLHTWARGIDLKDAIFTLGQAVLLPNNTSIAWMNAAASPIPVMFLSSADEVWLQAAAATGGVSVGNSASARSFRVAGVASAVNYVEASGNTTGNTPTVWAKGSDTDIGMTWGTKGAGVHSFYTGGASFYKQAEIGHVASAVNYVSLKGAVTTGHPILAAAGTDSNPSIIVRGKGTGGVKVQDGASANKFEVNTTGIGFFNIAPAAQGAIALPTGTIQRTTYATGTVTLPQLAGVVMAIITDMRAYGLSG